MVPRLRLLAPRTTDRRALNQAHDATACKKQGFFVAGFETPGEYVALHDEYIPLSRAICCRPCVQNDDRVSVAALAAITALAGVGEHVVLGVRKDRAARNLVRQRARRLGLRGLALARLEREYRAAAAQPANRLLVVAHVEEAHGGVVLEHAGEQKGVAVAQSHATEVEHLVRLG